MARYLVREILAEAYDPDLRLVPRYRDGCRYWCFEMFDRSWPVHEGLNRLQPSHLYELTWEEWVAEALRAARELRKAICADELRPIVQRYRELGYGNLAYEKLAELHAEAEMERRAKREARQARREQRKVQQAEREQRPHLRLVQ